MFLRGREKREIDGVMELSINSPRAKGLTSQGVN